MVNLVLYPCGGHQVLVKQDDRREYGHYSHGKRGKEQYNEKKVALCHGSFFGWVICFIKNGLKTAFRKYTNRCNFHIHLLV